jgi:DNA-directed RNA polymerase subunit RPC12/RpoP
MSPQISSDAFNAFFAWAPWVIGVVIYLAFFVAKRHERPAASAISGGESFACSQCGRRGAREQVVAQNYGSATGYLCSQCSTVKEALV